MKTVVDVDAVLPSGCWPPVAAATAKDKSRHAFWMLSKDEQAAVKDWLRAHGVDPGETPARPDVFEFDVETGVWRITQFASRPRRLDPATGDVEKRVIRVRQVVEPPEALTKLLGLWAQARADD